MATVLAGIFFSGVFALAVWTIAATVVPAWSRITAALSGEELFGRDAITCGRRPHYGHALQPRAVPVVIRLRAAA